MINLEQKSRLSQGGIYTLNIIGGSYEVTDKGKSIKLTLGNDEIEHPFFITMIDEESKEGKVKVFKAQINELVQGLCTVEQRKKKNPLAGDSYDVIANNIVELINNNVGKEVTFKAVINTYNGKSKIVFPAFGNWFSTKINDKVLKIENGDVIIPPADVTPSDSLLRGTTLSTEPQSDLKGDLPF